MSHLSLVKSLSHLQQEQSYADEILLDGSGLSFLRGSITELSGDASTGKRSIALALLAKLTTTGEICACVDAAGSFDPVTARLAGVELDNLLWARCGGSVEMTFLSADHLVQAKGFGAIWLDLTGIDEQKLRLVPRTYWYRYRTRIRETPTIIVVTSRSSVAGSASHAPYELDREHSVWSGNGSFKLLREFHLSITSKKHFTGPPLRTRAEFDYSEVRI
ncbi:MAG: hypothetical protein KF736_05650 [Acidobacteria bacterium]|nr:hypothetical protein [Acidobacteriota bacterium]